MRLTSIMMIVAVASAAAGCPTYSERSQPAGEDEDDVREVDEQPPDGEVEVRVVDTDEGENEAAADAPDEVADEEATGDGESDMVMHREEAGEPDDTGWYPARSTNGGFAVAFPAEFDDYEVTPGGDQVMYVMNAEREGVRYLVQCAVGEQDPEEILAAMDEQLSGADQMEQRRRVSHAGFDGLEFRLSVGEQTTLTMRSLVVDEMLCQQIVEATDTDYPDRDGARFMESFSLTRAE